MLQNKLQLYIKIIYIIKMKQNQLNNQQQLQKLNNYSIKLIKEEVKMLKLMKKKISYIFNNYYGNYNKTY